MVLPTPALPATSVEPPLRPRITIQGTSATPAISFGTSAFTQSTSASGTSNTSSSCTCMIIAAFGWRFFRRACRLIMAILMRSAAVP